jgi:uncharacterized protein
VKRVVALDKARPAEALWEILIEENAGEAFDAAAVEDARGHPKAAVLTHGQMGFVVMNHIADLMPGLGPQHASVLVAPLSDGADTLDVIRLRHTIRKPTCCSDNVTWRAPMQDVVVDKGSMAGVAFARIAPNEDLVQGMEKMCLAEAFRNTFARGVLGSLVDACLGTRDGKYPPIKGPAVEIISLGGEVRANADGSMPAPLSGLAAGPDGNVYGGPFVAGSNPIRLTLEVALQEWLPEAMAASC